MPRHYIIIYVNTQQYYYRHWTLRKTHGISNIVVVVVHILWIVDLLCGQPRIQQTLARLERAGDEKKFIVDDISGVRWTFRLHPLYGIVWTGSSVDVSL